MFDDTSCHTLKRFAPLDVFLILLLAGLAVFFAPFMQSHAPDTVVVYRDNDAIASYPLSDARSFTIRGALGPMRITIKNRTARVDGANCPEGICVRSRPIAKTSQQIVCEPNHIVLEISPAKDTLDAVSR